MADLVARLEAFALRVFGIPPGIDDDTDAGWLRRLERVIRELERVG